MNGEQVDALLDSGAELTIVDTRFAARIGLVGAKTVEARGTGAATTQADLVENVSILALGRQVGIPLAAIMNLSDIEARLIGAPLPVILGRELFDAGKIAIDIEASRIAWLPGDHPVEGVRLPLTSAHGVETIPVEFGEGINVQADFDLGNGTGLLISSELSDRLGLRPVGVEPGGGIGGAIGRPVVYVPELSIAGRIFRHVRAHVSDDMQVPANVGVGLLRNFRIVTDYPNRQLWLQPRT